MSNDEKRALAAEIGAVMSTIDYECVVVEHPVRLTGDQAAHIVRT